MVGINTYLISLMDARKLKNAMADVVAKQLVAARNLLGRASLAARRALCSVECLAEGIGYEQNMIIISQTFFKPTNHERHPRHRKILY
jgi:hypothetical protein